MYTPVPLVCAVNSSPVPVLRNSRLADGNTPPGQPAVESTWIEPYPDEAMGLPAGRAAPDASYDQREAVELAFVAATQHLAANQRAVLLLREVLGFSAKETATMLDTSVPSVNSALQRARTAVEERVPERSQQTTLRALGDSKLRHLIDRYVDAWERCDVPAFAGMLAEDATFAMPPLATWYTPRDTIVSWAGKSAMSGAWKWKGVLTRANAQPALAFYAWDDSEGAYLPFALNVLSLRDDGLLSDVTAFIVRSTEAPEPEAYKNFPAQPVDERQLAVTFTRFGVPDRLN